jgi:hypothetical protein
MTDAYDELTVAKYTPYKKASFIKEFYFILYSDCFRYSIDTRCSKPRLANFATPQLYDNNEYTHRTKMSLPTTSWIKVFIDE